MSNIDNIKNYTVIDLEMTGLSAKNDKIIEIGAARVRGGEIVDTISTLVNPKRKKKVYLENSFKREKFRV